MFLCFVSNGLNGSKAGYITTQITLVSDCANGFVAQSASSYTDLGVLFKTYFDFDPVLASQLVGWYLISFVTGHGLGRVIRLWRKAM